MIRYPFHDGCGGPLLTLEQVRLTVDDFEIKTFSQREKLLRRGLMCGTCKCLVLVAQSKLDLAKRAAKVERGERAGRTSARITAARRAAA